MRLMRRALLASLAAGVMARKPGRAAEAGGEGEIGRLVVRDPPVAVPAFAWADAAGHPQGIAAYGGRGIVLNFWATWCGPCVAELPSLAALAGGVGDRIAVVPVSNDAGGAAVVQAFYAAHRIAGLGVWLDPHGTGLAAVGGLGLPTTLIIDTKGREVARVAGGADWNAPGTIATLRALVGGA